MHVSCTLCGFVHALHHLLFPVHIIFWGGLCWVFMAPRQLALVTASRGYSLVAARGLLIVTASLVSETGSGAHSLSTCGAWASSPCEVWISSQSVSPALSAGLLSPGPPGKFHTIF